MSSLQIMAAGLLVALALGGCLGADTTEEPPAPSGAGPVEPAATEAEAVPPPVPIGNTTGLVGNFTGCSDQVGLFPMPVEPYADQIPEGFTPVPFEDLPGTVTAVMFASTCETLSLDGNVTEAPAMMVGAILLDAPTELAGSAEDHAILIGAITNSEAIAQTFRDHGMDIDIGSVDLAVTVTPAARIGTGHADAGGYTVDVSSVVPATGADAGGFNVRLFGYSGSRLIGTIDVRSSGGTEYGPGEGQTKISEVPPILPPAAVIHTDGAEHIYEMRFTLWTTPAAQEDGADDGQTNGGFENTYQNARNEKKSVK